MRKIANILFMTLLLAGCSKPAPSAREGLNDGPAPSNYFSSDSVWNRKIPDTAEYRDVQDAIWGDEKETPIHLSVDLTTVLYLDRTQPLVDFRLTQGWNYPERSKPRGEVLFQRHLSQEAGSDLRYPKTGNALYAIIDSSTGLADEGVGTWRDVGGDFLTLYDDDKLHGIDVVKGDGLTGPRGSGLSALGGMIRSGELDTGIHHALAVMLSSRRYSRENHFIWPASRGDAFAPNPEYGYLGDTPYYTMGTLLAIPPEVDLSSISWKTPQGRVLAKSAQEYGWYIVDSGTGERGGHSFKFAMEREAAREDIGLAFNPETDDMTIDPAKMDNEGIASDVQEILRLVKAVTNNK